MTNQVSIQAHTGPQPQYWNSMRPETAGRLQRLKSQHSSCSIAAGELQQRLITCDKQQLMHIFSNTAVNVAADAGSGSGRSSRSIAAAAATHQQQQQQQQQQRTKEAAAADFAADTALVHL